MGEQANEFRFLHTMLRVKDLDKSLDFYTRLLHMKVLRKKDFPGGKFTLAFVGYGDEADHTVIELTHNWDQDEPYDLYHRALKETHLGDSQTARSLNQ